MKEQTEVLTSQFEVKEWSLSTVDKIHAYLEVPNWAPWLSASKESLAGRTAVFPQGQLVIWDPSTDLPAASISTNKIFWSGERRRSAFLG